MTERRQELDTAFVLCLIESIAQHSCRTAKVVRRQEALLDRVAAAVEQLMELQRSANPSAALELDRLAGLRAEVKRCCEDTGDDGCGCPSDQGDECDCLCRGGRGHNVEEGWSVKSRATVDLVEVPERHRPWKPVDKPHHEDDEELSPIPRGSFFGRLEPVPQTPAPMDFRSGAGPTPGGQGPGRLRDLHRGRHYRNMATRFLGRQGR